MINVIEQYTVSDQCVMQLNHHIEAGIYTVDLNYMNGAVIATMMGSKNESTATWFYENLEGSYEELAEVQANGE
ncbi:hypothetical protein Presley_76 [Acinetobacter phage Presley]|uniref:Uncharacterized protein n=1 Tax=Acinetobacter phage Presley TaxID=1406780 RepID=U5PZZ1_9CAUD|nr:hypothetical protein Presley_76 [Acinetobacter phage Presley]AGY48143.1 hypothetical protein Presley_76 [Acinetobacter phage Presley]